MIDHLIRDLQDLRKADFLIGKIWPIVLVRRAALFAFAAVIGVFGRGMVNVASLIRDPLDVVSEKPLVPDACRC